MLGGVCSRGGTSLQPATLPQRLPFRSEAPGWQDRKGFEPSRRPGSPSHGLAPARRCFSTPIGETPRPALGGDQVPRPRGRAEASASSLAGPGGGALRAGPRGSTPLCGLSRLLARQVNHRGPMTTGPTFPAQDPERQPRGSPRRFHCCGRSSSSSPGLQTPVHLGFPQRLALRDGT